MTCAGLLLTMKKLFYASSGEVTGGSARGPLRRCAPSEDEHTDRGPEHEKGRDAHRHAAENRARLLFHQLAARSDEENADEEKRGQQSICDGGPVESL